MTVFHNFNLNTQNRTFLTNILKFIFLFSCQSKDIESQDQETRIRVSVTRPGSRVKWLHWLIDDKSRWLHLMTRLRLTLTQVLEFLVGPLSPLSSHLARASALQCRTGQYWSEDRGTGATILAEEKPETDIKICYARTAIVHYWYLKQFEKCLSCARYNSLN